MIDFRGLPANASTLSGCSFVNCDLSGAVFASAWLEDCHFDNTRLDRADLSDISDQGNSFGRCPFCNTRFVKAAIGYKGSKFLGCRLVKANFRGAVFVRAEFDDCAFSECGLKGVDFNASCFRNCSFEGPLNDVWFRGGFPLASDVTECGEPQTNCMRNTPLTCAAQSLVKCCENNFSPLCQACQTTINSGSSLEPWLISQSNHLKCRLIKNCANLRSEQRAPRSRREVGEAAAISVPNDSLLRRSGASHQFALRGAQPISRACVARSVGRKGA